jgi:hypothetical protein
MIILTNNEFSAVSRVIDCPVLSQDTHLHGLVTKVGIMPTIPETVFVSGSGLGSSASSLSNTHQVYGLSSWTDLINTHLNRKLQLAVKLGMLIPNFKICSDQMEFDTLCATGQWETLTKNILFKKTHGLSLCVEAFYHKGEFKNYFVKVKGTRLLYGNVGPIVKNPITTTFSMPNPKLVPWFEKLSKIMLLESPEYRGPVTISGIIFGDKCTFKDIVFGYDADTELAKIALCGKTILVGECKVPKGYASTVRLYDIRKEKLRLGSEIPEYVHPAQCIRDEDGNLVSSGETPFIVVGLGDKIVTSFDNAYEIVRKVKVQELCYRPDGGTYAVEWWKKSKAAGLL